MRERVNVTLADYLTAPGLSWLGCDKGQCLPPRAGQGQAGGQWCPAVLSMQVAAACVRVPAAITSTASKRHSRSLALPRPLRAGLLPPLRSSSILPRWDCSVGSTKVKTMPGLLARAVLQGETGRPMSPAAHSAACPQPRYPACPSPTCRRGVCRPRGSGGDQS